MRAAAPSVSVPPYTDLARSYDRAMGLPAFAALRRAFAALSSRYGIWFRSAADIGCGTGRFTRHLSLSHRVPVIGVDRSAAMLEVAARHLAGTGVRLLRQDIRRLCLPAPVDLVTATFDTINHVMDDGDVQEVFRRVFENLNPGGFFLFDALTPAVPLPPRGILVHHVPARRARLLLTLGWERGRRALRLTFTRISRSGPPVRELHRERPYSIFDLDRWLRAAGFVVRGVHDAASLSLAHAGSPRVILVAQRPPTSV